MAYFCCLLFFQTYAGFGQTTKAECIFLKTQVQEQSSLLKKFKVRSISNVYLTEINIDDFLFPGEFVKKHGLQAGDYLSIHRNPASATYVRRSFICFNAVNPSFYLRNLPVNVVPFPIRCTTCYILCNVI